MMVLTQETTRIIVVLSNKNPFNKILLKSGLMPNMIKTKNSLLKIESHKKLVNNNRDNLPFR